MNFENPIRLVTRVRNNRLIIAREELGYATMIAAATSLGIGYQMISDYEGMRRSPWNAKTGEWNSTALELAEAYGYLPEDLWPEVISLVRKNKIEMELSEAAAFQLAEAQSPAALYDYIEMREKVQEVIGKLRTRERNVIEMRFGLDGKGERTIRQIGRQLRGVDGVIGISGARVEQMALKALRKLRHPSQSKHLKEFAESSTKKTAEP